MYLYHAVEELGSVEVTRSFQKLVTPPGGGPVDATYAVTVWPMPGVDLLSLEALVDVARRELAALGVEQALHPLDAWETSPDGPALRCHVAAPVPGAARLDNVLSLVAAYEAGRSHAVLAFQELAEAGRPATLDPVPSGVGVPGSPFAAFAYRLGWRYAIEAAT